MREGAKKRLTGLFVIVVLAVIFVPMLFEDKAREPTAPSPITALPVPGLDDRYRTESFMIPVEPEQPGVPPDLLEDAAPEASLQDAPTAGLGIVEEALEPVFESSVDGPLPVPQTPPARTTAQAPATQAPATQARATPAPAATRPRPTPVPVARQTPPADEAGRTWIVQVASLGSVESAERLVARLRGEGFPAFVETAQVRGRTYYRVRVGPETDREKVEIALARLRQSFGDALIQRYR
ncbi:MAG: SPOR domain-containing protein [Gammaproteobacteria bacterium]|nr:SPOR domain-containing protein [Gammaproteobacteria bacterium]